MFEPDWWITRSTNALYGKHVVKIRKTWTEGTALTTLYMTFHHPALLYIKLPLRDTSLTHCLNSLEMATRVLWVPFASICMIFAMLLSVVMSDSIWSYVHSSIPTPSPNTGTGNGASAAADLSPHFLTTMLFASIALLLPFCLSFFC